MTGEPEHPETFIPLQDDDIKIYLAQEIWESLKPGTEKLLFAVEGYGRYWLWLGGGQKKNPKESKDG